MSERPPTWCRYEVMTFPGSEFEVDPEWGLVHVTKAGRHTSMGTVISAIDNGMTCAQYTKQEDSLDTARSTDMEAGY